MLRNEIRVVHTSRGFFTGFEGYLNGYSVEGHENPPEYSGWTAHIGVPTHKWWRNSGETLKEALGVEEAEVYVLDGVTLRLRNTSEKHWDMSQCLQLLRKLVEHIDVLQLEPNPLVEDFVF